MALSSRSASLLVVAVLASQPRPASADDCLGVTFTRGDHPTVLGRVVSVRWTSTPCHDPRSFACALTGGTASEVADVTIEVRQRWTADGAAVTPEPGRMRVIGPQPRRRGACGADPLRVGSLRVFVLGEAIDGGHRIVASYPWIKPWSAWFHRGGATTGSAARPPRSPRRE